MENFFFYAVRFLLFSWLFDNIGSNENDFLNNIF